MIRCSVYYVKMVYALIIQGLVYAYWVCNVIVFHNCPLHHWIIAKVIRNFTLIEDLIDVIYVILEF